MAAYSARFPAPRRHASFHAAHYFMPKFTLLTGHTAFNVKFLMILIFDITWRDYRAAFLYESSLE